MLDRTINASIDEIESAKETAVALMANTSNQNTLDLFYTEKLDDIENGIKNLNNFSTTSWLMSAILLYTLIYNKGLYIQSGLSWSEYSKQSKKRIGLDYHELSEQLSVARFFIKHHQALERAGFTPIGNNRKLSRAELATELCGDVNLTIQHLVNDTWKDFFDWYNSYRIKELPEKNDNSRNDIQITNNKFIINGVEAVTISDSISESDKNRITEYVKQIFEVLQQGYEPAIISVYDRKEASILPHLRDKYRQGK